MMTGPINLPERTAYRDASAIAAAHDASVHLHTKLSDLVDPPAGPLFDWATRAHIDVLVRDERSADLQPLVAIEVDGRSHEASDQLERDRVKDRLLRDGGIDVIRVKAGDALRRHGRERLTAHLLKLWFASRSFYEAQERGDIPLEETFFHPFTYEYDEATKYMVSMDPAMEVRELLWRDHRATGIPVCPIPQTFHRHLEERAETEAKTFLPLSDTQFLFGRAVVGTFDIRGVLARDIAEEAALLEIADDYRAWRRGDATARGIHELSGLLPLTASLLATAPNWRLSGSSSYFQSWLEKHVGADRAQSLSKL